MPVHAGLTFTTTFGTSITSLSNSAAIQTLINNTLATYSADFSDSVTVALDFENVSSGLGQSVKPVYSLDYSTFCTALKADASTSNDATANASLGSCGSPGTGVNPVDGATTIGVSSANGRAVGIATAGIALGSGFAPCPSAAILDGCISINFGLTTIGAGATTGAFIAQSVLEHEIDEVLGLGSALSGSGAGPTTPRAQDLFRYASAGVRSYGGNAQTTVACTGAPNAFFSINGGITDLAQFNNCNNGGDYGDYQSGIGNPAQVQDAFATPGANPALNTELTGLDVIGYTFASATPEPATYALVGFALAAVGFARRRMVRK